VSPVQDPANLPRGADCRRPPTDTCPACSFELADANETGYEESLKKLAKTGLLSVGEDLMKELNP
jgi:hypothetical protein